MNRTNVSNVLVIGSGAAGLRAAIARLLALLSTEPKET
jgi:succinate dehydrogenase/fumarate reductase flavoprotein subunit